MSKIDSLLNRFTMYKVVLYGLILLIFYAFLLTIPDLLPFNSIELGLSIAVIVNTCFITNFLFKKLFHAFTNSESWLITALILVLIVLPPSEFTLQELYPIFLISFLAIASKFLIAYRKKHLFNPVAISLVIMGMLGFGIGTWWVATPFMFIPTLIIGLFIVKKIRRFHMFLAFLIPASATMLLFGFIQGFSLLDIFNQSFLSWPIIFFGTIMLTEPLTTPPRKIEQIYYGAFVGFIFGTQYKIGPLYSTPELALVVGNIYSHTTQLKQKVFLSLQQKRQIADETYEFVFKASQKIPFLAGQYLEWTLPHKKEDFRGNRRYFTIASSPTEDEIKLGVRFNKPSSSYKTALLEMHEGDKILAGSLYGDFVLQKDEDKYVFIAGGIGITPFRSMIKYLLDKNMQKDIYLLYSCKFLKDVSYEKLFQDAKNVGVKVICIITDENESIPTDGQFVHGRITEDVIKKHIPDFEKRKYFLSGPNAMVEGYKKMLKELSIPGKHIHTDYFPGF